MPADVVWRHPFPGPGLGVRLLCSTGEEDREHFDGIDGPLTALARRLGLEAMALPIRSVGVKADLWSYEHPVLLSSGHDWSRLQEMAGEIYREVPHINRRIWWANQGPLPGEVRPAAATVTRARPAT